MLPSVKADTLKTVGRLFKKASPLKTGTKTAKEYGQADSRPAKSFDEPYQVEGYGA